MPKAFDGSTVPLYEKTMPCGGIPVWDYSSEAGYRCDTCNAVIGSIGQPKQCVDLQTVITQMGFKEE